MDDMKTIRARCRSRLVAQTVFFSESLAAIALPTAISGVAQRPARAGKLSPVVLTARKLPEDLPAREETITLAWTVRDASTCRVAVIKDNGVKVALPGPGDCGDGLYMARIGLGRNNGRHVVVVVTQGRRDRVAAGSASADARIHAIRSVQRHRDDAQHVRRNVGTEQERRLNAIATVLHLRLQRFLHGPDGGCVRHANSAVQRGERKRSRRADVAGSVAREAYELKLAHQDAHRRLPALKGQDFWLLHSPRRGHVLHRLGRSLSGLVGEAGALGGQFGRRRGRRPGGPTAAEPVWGRLEDEPPERVAAYARRTVINTCRTQWRHYSSHEVVVLDIGELPLRPTEPAFEDRPALREALGRLSARQHACVLPRYVVDLPDREIALRLGMSPITVRTASARGLHALRATIVAA